jgi:hypothetical protein
MAWSFGEVFAAISQENRHFSASPMLARELRCEGLPDLAVRLKNV